MFLFFTELAEKHPANSFCLFGIEKFDLRGVSGHGIFVEVIFIESKLKTNNDENYWRKISGI